MTVRPQKQRGWQAYVRLVFVGSVLATNGLCDDSKNQATPACRHGVVGCGFCGNSKNHRCLYTDMEVGVVVSVLTARTISMLYTDMEVVVVVSMLRARTIATAVYRHGVGGHGFCFDSKNHNNDVCKRADGVCGFCDDSREHITASTMFAK